MVEAARADSGPMSPRTEAQCGTVMPVNIHLFCNFSNKFWVPGGKCVILPFCHFNCYSLGYLPIGHDEGHARAHEGVGVQWFNGPF